MILCVVASFPIGGLKPYFCLGLLIGTLISILNVCLMTLITEISVQKENKFLPALGLLLRVIIYAAAFLVTLLYFGFEGGLGTAIGFLTVYVAIIYINAVDLRIAKKKAAKAQEAAVTGTVLNKPLPDSPKK
jgi:hypothetical protein